MAEQIYITILGDTWDGIAFKLYGDELAVGEIMDINRGHIKTVIFSAGVELRLPEIATQPASTLPLWKG